MASRNRSIVRSRETHAAQTAQYVVGHLAYAVHGHGEAEREYACVGFMSWHGARRHIPGFELGGDWIITCLGLGLPTRRLSRVTVYAPQSKRRRMHGPIMQYMGKVIGRCQRKGATLIMGEPKVRVNTKLSGAGEVLGPHIWGRGRATPTRGMGPML